MLWSVPFVVVVVKRAPREVRGSKFEVRAQPWTSTRRACRGALRSIASSTAPAARVRAVSRATVRRPLLVILLVPVVFIPRLVLSLVVRRSGRAGVVVFAVVARLRRLEEPRQHEP